MKVPLRLERYFYTKIICIANSEFDPGVDQQSGNGEMIKEVRLMRHAEDERRWQVVLDIKTPPDEEKSAPYQLNIEVVGFFTVAPDAPHDPEELVGITGSSMLYSATREFVLGLSSRGPWPPVFLPTISYQTRPHEKSEFECKFTEPDDKAAGKDTSSRKKTRRTGKQE